jgi:hypothetical protein
MDIIKPAQIKQADIVTYNVPMDTPIWAVGTTYNTGDKVTLDDCGAVVYESLTDNNIGNDPRESPLEWLKLDAPSNCFAMFDRQVVTRTVGDAAIDDGAIKIKFNASNISGLAFLNVVATSIYVKIFDELENEILFEHTETMRDTGVDSWFDWYYSDWVEKSSYINIDFPKLIQGTIEVHFYQIGGVAEVGEFIYGDVFNIGIALFGAGLELKDFSRVEQDEFGRSIIVKRPSSKRATYPVKILNPRFDIVFKTLDSLRATPILWIASRTQFEETRVLGFFRDLRMDIATPAGTDCSLIITGVR